LHGEADGRTPRQAASHDEVDLASKLIRVHGGDVDPAAVVAVIDAAGYDAVRA
jgi:hypothetical protein